MFTVSPSRWRAARSGRRSTTLTSVSPSTCEVGGASAVSQSRALDRHWRNARVLASHNPLIYRARILGHYVVNGVSPERKYTVGQAPA